MDKLKQWLAAHSITTHSIAIGIAALMTAYEDVPVFHDYVQSIYVHLPMGTHNLLTAAIALYAWYRKGQPAQ